MNFYTSVSDLLAFFTVISGILVITSQSPVVSVVYLIVLFVMAACYLITIGVVFIGLSYLVVYVGAVAVLFLFVVIILNVRLSEVVSVGLEYTKSLPLGFILGTVFLFEMLSVLPAVFTADTASNLAITIFTNINTILLSVSIPTTVNTSYAHTVFSGTSLDQGLGSLGSVQALAQGIYLTNALWLIVVSIVLLLAILGPIILCAKTRQ